MGGICVVQRYIVSYIIPIALLCLLCVLKCGHGPKTVKRAPAGSFLDWFSELTCIQCTLEGRFGQWNPRFVGVITAFGSWCLCYVFANVWRLRPRWRRRPTLLQGFWAAHTRLYWHRCTVNLHSTNVLCAFSSLSLSAWPIPIRVTVLWKTVHTRYMGGFCIHCHGPIA